MGRDPECVDSDDPAALFGFFENLVNTDQPNIDRSRVDQRLLDETSDIGAIWELLMSVRYHRPRCEAITFEEASALGNDRIHWRLSDPLPESKKVCDEDSLSVGGIEYALLHFDGLSIPTGKKDEIWKQKNDALHEALTTIWTKARQNREKNLQKQGCNKEDANFLISLFFCPTEHDHLESLSKEKKAVIDNLQSGSVTAKADDELNQRFWDAPATESSSLDRRAQQKKTKVKTRPDNTIERADNSQYSGGENLVSHDTASSNSNTPTSYPIIRLKPENHRIFMTMFPSSESPSEDKSTEKAGSLHWRRFIAAMADAGFSATGSGGSAFTFANNHSGEKIVFHRPHPTPRVEQTKLICWGKRLKWHFGMRRETFEVV